MIVSGDRYAMILSSETLCDERSDFGIEGLEIGFEVFGEGLVRLELTLEFSLTLGVVLGSILTDTVQESVTVGDGASELLGTGILDILIQHVDA